MYPTNEVIGLHLNLFKINKESMKYLSYSVMTYMLLALVWWAILLSRSNRQLHDYKAYMISKGFDPVAADQVLIRSNPHLMAEFHAKRRMIIGEGIVFGFSLILGMYLIQKAYTNQLKTIRNQKNFMLSVSHELKTPITAINLLSETMIKRDLDKSKVRELSEDILSESTRLEKLVSNILLATRLENPVGLRFEKIRVNELLENIIRSASHSWPEASVALNSALPEGLYMEADQDAFVSIMNNLIDNGVKYSDGPARIILSASLIGDDVEISVADEGLGIPAEEKANITRLFYRIGPEETRKTKGTGIGLYIVDRLVKAHSGKLVILDNQPKGSVFKFRIPLTRPKR